MRAIQYSPLLALIAVMDLPHNLLLKQFSSLGSPVSFTQRVKEEGRKMEGAATGMDDGKEGQRGRWRR